MTAYSFTTFVDDTGARTQVTRAGEVNNNFLHCLAAMPPIGSIVAHYDYNAALTINSDYWRYCDGSSVTITGIGTQTLPDLSNRYLVGFGTEGGGDIDTAAWATAAVGNASHQVDLSHTHTFTTGAGGAHSHGAGTLQFSVGRSDTGSFITFAANGADQTVYTIGYAVEGGGEPYAKSPATGIKVRRVPEVIPGIESGKVTFQNVLVGVA
jgi:hypothetical protein